MKLKLPTSRAKRAILCLLAAISSLGLAAASGVNAAMLSYEQADRWRDLRFMLAGGAFYLFLAIALTCLVLAVTVALRKPRGPMSCTHCRYDLSGTPPGSPCPECGRGAK